MAAFVTGRTTINITLSHTSTLLKYTGISFIAGSVTHGAFTGQRSIITAMLGVVFFVLGTVLEKTGESEKPQSLTRLLLIGIFGSVGLGLFTGGLQHFPDSPDRSAWVVPLGFLISLIALYLTEAKAKVGSAVFTKYALIGTIVVALASFAALHIFDDHDDDHHTHDVKGHQSGTKAPK